MCGQASALHGFGGQTTPQKLSCFPCQHGLSAELGQWVSAVAGSGGKGKRGKLAGPSGTSTPSGSAGVQSGTPVLQG